MTEQPPIRLARHFEVFIEDQVAAGHYGSATDLIEEALRLLERRESKRDALVRALIEGEQSGEATPLDMADIAAKAKERVRTARAA
jgi:antitoxin ParD1/3/4